LAAQGHTVSVFSADPSYSEEPQYDEWTGSYRGFTVHRVRTTAPLYPNRVLSEYYRPFVGQRFARFLERGSFDVVHFFHVRFLGTSLLEEAWLRGIPSVVHFMDFWSVCPRITLMRPSKETCAGPDSIAECVTCMRGDKWSGYDALGEALDGGKLVPADLSHLDADDPSVRNESGFAPAAAAARTRTAFVRKRFEMAGVRISPSKFLRSVLVRNGFREDSIQVLGYGVRDELVPISGDRKGPMRFGFIGSLVPHKGAHVLIEAFLQMDWPEATLSLHGEPWADPDYSVYLKNLSRGDPRVRFAGSFAPHELPRIQSEIDVLVAPSIWFENTPFVVLEARASQIPVVASRLGGFEEIVEDGRDGLLFECGDAADLARKLGQFRSDPGLWKRLHEGMRPVKRMSEHVREILAVYAEAREKARAQHVGAG